MKMKTLGDTKSQSDGKKRSDNGQNLSVDNVFVSSAVTIIPFISLRTEVSIACSLSWCPEVFNFRTFHFSIPCRWEMTFAGVTALWKEIWKCVNIIPSTACEQI